MNTLSQTSPSFQPFIKPKSLRSRGFTLIEAMITLAIIGLLASFALPAYQDNLRRGQLPEGVAGLASYRVKMEQYYQDNRRYGTGACADGANAPAWSNFVDAGTTYFTFSCALSDAGQGYVLTATGSSGKAVGHVYTLNQNNAKATTRYKAASVTKACWVLKGDEC